MNSWERRQERQQIEKYTKHKPFKWVFELRDDDVKLTEFTFENVKRTNRHSVSNITMWSRAEDMIEWLKEHKIEYKIDGYHLGYTTWWFRGDPKPSNGNGTIKFRKKKDLLRFKLVWS